MSTAPQAAPAAPTLAAIVDDTYDAARLTVGVPAGATRLWLWRIGPSGTVAYVRGWQDGAVLAGDSVTVLDYEVPLGVPVAYHAAVANPAGELSAEPAPVSVTIPTTDCTVWLGDLGQPGNSQRITIETLAELGYEVPTGVHYVLDRRAPITTADIARTPTFELTFLTETDDARVRARDTLGDGAPLLLRTSPDLGIGNLYWVCPHFSEQRVTTLGAVKMRRFVCAGVQIERPDAQLWLPDSVTESYAEVEGEFTTYADVEAGRATYADLLYEPIGAPPPPEPVVPWPAVDV